MSLVRSEKRELRFMVFHEFTATLPLDELRACCSAVDVQLVFDRAAQPSQQLSTDAQKAVVQNNLKVFCSPRQLQSDASLLHNITSILKTASMHLKWTAPDRWVFEQRAEGSLDEAGDDHLPLQASSTMTSTQQASPAFHVACAFLGNSMFELPGTRLGDRLVPVDEFEHESNMRDCDLQMQRIDDGLYLGPYVSLCDLQELKEKGITHAVNASQKISVVAQRAGIEVLDIDIKDSDKARMEPHLPSTRAFITEALKNGGVVLVCCFAGISRSATIVIDFLMFRDGIDFKTARNRVKAQRMCIKPNAGFRSELERIHRKRMAAMRASSSSSSSSSFSFHAPSTDAPVSPIPFPSLADVTEETLVEALLQTTSPTSLVDVEQESWMQALSQNDLPSLVDAKE
jgi:hypothetical protein